MHKKIIEHYMMRVWNEKDLDHIFEIFAEDAVIHSPLGEKRTPQDMYTTVKTWIEAIPDIEVTLLRTLEDGEITISHWKAKGTHQKELHGILPQGKPVSYSGVTMYRMQEGKIAEYWAYLDSWSLQAQMS